MKMTNYNNDDNSNKSCYNDNTITMLFINDDTSKIKHHDDDDDDDDDDDNDNDNDDND